MKRNAALDAARGLSVLAMFVAHAYDGWVLPAQKLGLGYRLTREIAAFAMPSFVLFAGVGLGLQMLAQRPRGPAIARGARLVLAGYALSLAYAIVDSGLSLATVLRADALHAIGASLALVALLLPPCKKSARLRARALVLALLIVLATPWLTRALRGVVGLPAYALAPLVQVPGVTRFCAFPLAALCALGVALASLLPRATGARAGITLTGAGAVAVLGFSLLTNQVLGAVGGKLEPAHLAVIPNAFGGASRALCLLGLGALVTLPSRSLLARALAALGRRSLLAYSLHLPLCYGRLGAPLHARLELSQATLGCLLLALTAAGLALLAERTERSRHRARPGSTGRDHGCEHPHCAIADSAAAVQSPHDNPPLPWHGMKIQPRS